MNNSKTLREKLAGTLLSLHLSTHVDYLNNDGDSEKTKYLRTRVDNLKGIMNTKLYKALEGIETNE
jgi:hypothetical protein